MTPKRSLLFALLAFFLNQLAAQTVPPLMNYQGQLLGPGGTNLPTADYQLTFNIYDTAQGGDPVWGPQIFDGRSGAGYGPKIPVVQGYFNVMLGPTDTQGRSLAEAFTTANRWVEIKVDDHNPIAPRQQILSAPFAIRAAFSQEAANAHNLAGKPVGDFVAKGGDTMTGPLTLPANGLVAGGAQLVLAHGNVGIGTANPWQKLSLPFGGSLSFGQSELYNFNIYKTSAGHLNTYFDSTDDNADTRVNFRMRTGGTPLYALTIRGDGNVGIGTDMPDSRFQVFPNDLCSYRFTAASNSGAYSTTFSMTEAGLRIGHNSSQRHLSLQTDNVDRLVVSSAGDVGIGIGTTVPSAALHVRGSLMAEGTGGAGSVILKSTAFGGHRYELRPDERTAGDLMLYDRTANARRLEVTATGRVGIKSDTVPPECDLHVYGSAGKPGGGPWSSTSDARVKKNIEPIQRALERLLELRGKTFEFKEPAKIGELPGRHTGMLAQEVEKVFPEWVDEGPNGYKRLGFRGFEALTVEALRDLRAEKDAQIADLKAQVAALERQLQSFAAQQGANR